MLNKLNELRKGKEEGFTLIELLVVILIIGVLSAIALPIFLNQQKESLKAATKSDVRNTVTNVATWIVSHPSESALSDQIGTTSDKLNLVQSDGTTVTITTDGTTGKGGYDGYTVKGVNSGVSGFSYSFNSATGKYTSVG